MAATKPLSAEDERLPLILGFQRIAENTAEATRFIDHGKGIYVYDTNGNEYIEATASFYVASLGYQHDELVDAIESQYRELPFYVSGLNRTAKSSLDLAERLVDLVPIKNSHLLFASTGSEANDFLIKMLRFGAVARGEPQRKTIIGRHASYHGGTLAAASLTGGHHEEFGLPIEGFEHIAQPDYHGNREPGESPADFVRRLRDELKALIEQQSEGSVAAFFAEPISFSAGFKIPPKNYFAELCSVLSEYGIDFVADEVVTGMGRTGSMFGSETFGLKPQHMTFGKGITGGYFPLSGIAIGQDLYHALEVGSERVGTLAHAGTFSAHPVGAAAAVKVLEIIERDRLIEHARRMGERLSQRLNALVDHPLVGKVNTLGLAGAIDFLRRDSADRPINANADDCANAVYQALLARGVVTRPAGRNVLIAPPLIITESEVDEIVDRLALALDDVALTFEHVATG